MNFSVFAFVEVKQNSAGSSSGGGSYSGPVGVYYADGRNNAAETSGTWQQDSAGWKYKLSNGRYPTNTWYECDWNGQKLWYHFNAEGYVDSGWFTDTDGNTYYLHPLHDGNFGYMYTGWNTIDGKNYYFSMDSASGILKGALLKDTVTPDGRTVGADGALIG